MNCGYTEGMGLRYLTPLDVAIRAFGTVSEIARVCQISQPAVSHWRMNSQGCIPHSSRLAALHTEAKRRGIDLSLESLIYGMEIEE